MNVQIKPYTRNVQKFMQILNQGETSMPVGVASTYDTLRNNLIQLRSDLNLCNKRNHPEVMRFCELIVELMNETASIYVQMECTHDARPSNNNDIKNVIPQQVTPVLTVCL